MAYAEDGRRSGNSKLVYNKATRSIDKVRATPAEYRETMRARQAPYVYAGKKCDQHRPRWVGCAEGDKDGDGDIGATIKLAAKTFPPGTVMRIEEPLCPKCRSVPYDMGNGRWECDCDFDWREWASCEFS